MIKVIQIYKYFAKEYIYNGTSEHDTFHCSCFVFVNESEINKNPLWNRFLKKIEETLWLCVNQPLYLTPNTSVQSKSL